MMNELIVLLPAYNEEEDVEKLVDTWQTYKADIDEKYGLRLRIVVVNDGSADRTEEICHSLENQYDNFTLVNHEHNKGLGEAVKTGFTYVVNQCPNAKYACLMDCDNTQHPKYVLDMLEKIGGREKKRLYDVIIASRYQKGATVKGVAKYRLLTSGGARFVYWAILHVKGVKDYTCGYRLYASSILKKGFERYGADFVQESGFTCMAEVLFKLYRVGARFAEVPFELRYDFKGGASKMKVLKTAWNSVTMAMRLRRKY